MQVGNIIQGHLNNLLNINEEMSKNRLKICYACPLFTSRFGGMCNSRLWLNPNTGDVSLVEEKDYKRGCGCVLSAKTRVASQSCPAGKW